MTKGGDLGPYLKQLRESRSLSLRQVATAAGLSSGYLSQVEGGKRGRRKSGDFFAPHPQLLKKLAEVYHVPAADLLERAGYLEEQKDYFGFSEEKEIERCFDFVLHDPVVKQAFTTDEKRAVIQRYEALTGRKLITWAGEESALSKKSTLTGLHVEEGLLHADTVHQTLTADELAHELGIPPDEVKTLVEHGHLRAKRTATKELIFDKQEIRFFKWRGLSGWLKLLKIRDAQHLPETNEERLKAMDEVIHQEGEPARERIKQKITQHNRTIQGPTKKGPGET